MSCEPITNYITVIPFTSSNSSDCERDAKKNWLKRATKTKITANAKQ